MASVRVNVNPSYVSSYGDSWQGAGGWVSNNWSTMNITSAFYDTDAHTLTLNYDLRINRDGYGSGHDGYNVAAICGWVNGTVAKFYHGNDYTFINTDWYDQDSGHRTVQTLWSGTYVINNWTPGTNITLRVASLQDWGYTGARWDNNNYRSDSGDDPVTPTPEMICDGTVTNGTALGSVKYSATASMEGQTISSYAWTIDGQTITQADGQERTMTNITQNSNITWSVTATSSGGVTASDSGTLATKHQAPTLSFNTWTDGVRSGDTCAGTLSFNRTFYSGASFGSHSLVYGQTTSYGTSATDPGSGTTWSLSGLDANTKYYYKLVETDDGLVPATTTLNKNGQGEWLYFTTQGNNPSVTNVAVVPTSDGEGADISFTAEADGPNADIESAIIKYRPDGVSPTPQWEQEDVTGGTGSLTDLEPATTYEYELVVTDDNGHTTTTTGTFRTASHAPRDIEIIGKEIGNNSIKIGWTVDCPAGDPITGITLSVNGGSPITISTSSTDYTISNLASDQDYYLTMIITNSTGSGYSDAYLFTTVLNAPTLTTTTTAPVFNQIQIVASGSINPSRTLKYRFSNDNGTTWSAEQSSGTYTFNNLTAETTYHIVTEVRAVHTGAYSGDVYVYVSEDITTPADQAKVRLKTNDSWVLGKAWVKVNGVWKKAKKVYVKKNGEWILNKNG